MKDIEYVVFSVQPETKEFMGCSIHYREVTGEDYDNIGIKKISKAEIVKALQLDTDFEYLKDEFGVNCLVKRTNNDRSLLHLLKDAQQVILNNCELLEENDIMNPLENKPMYEKIKSALRHLKV